jgi:hypothetical protein
MIARSDKGFSTNVYYVNSHLLGKCKLRNYEKKLCSMIEKYKNRTSYPSRQPKGR